MLQSILFDFTRRKFKQEHIRRVLPRQIGSEPGVYTRGSLPTFNVKFLVQTAGKMLYLATLKYP